MATVVDRKSAEKDDESSIVHLLHPFTFSAIANEIIHYKSIGGGW
jgi:hypothetical protein